MLIKYYIIAASVFMFFISGCTTTPALVVKAGSGDQTVTAKAGKAFSIQLEAQLSTGYSWKLASAPASLKIIKETVLPLKETEKDITGGFEIQEFVLMSAEKGELTLTFNYARHWMKVPDNLKTSTVKVKIE